ncbi:hypothetical protein Dimus_013334 [Dionaea muscipula]
MGKIDELESQQSGWDDGASRNFCRRWSLFMGVSGFAHHVNLKCLLVLILGSSIFLSALFMLLPYHSVDFGFDASEATKVRATVQAYFRLEKPILQLISYIGQLEDELFGEVGVPDTKVAVLSMHQSHSPNWTEVVFGVLPDSINSHINPVSLTLLKSTFIDLFLLQSNLTMSRSIFGQPSSFELLKFAGGVTVIPVQFLSIRQMPQVLFNFSLGNSISDINENLAELKQQLKAGLHLKSSETAYVQVTNVFGSTTNPPVTVQATVLSDVGSLVPERLKQLAEIIQTSPPSRNLGLNNKVFGKVNSIVLSSYMEHTIDAVSPESSRALSPDRPVSPSPSPPFAGYADPPNIKGLPRQPAPNPPEHFRGTPTPSPTPHELRRHSSHAPALSPNPSTQPSSSPSLYCPSKGIQRIGCIALLLHLLYLVC